MNEPVKINGWAQGLYAISKTQKEVLGSFRLSADGRKFRYAKAGGADLAAGKIGIMAALVANHTNIAMTVGAAIGALEIRLTVGATLVSQDQYKDGYLLVNDATGKGHMYVIESNMACASGGTTIVKLKDPIRVALVTATSEVTLLPNPWNGVTESATEENGAAGVALVPVTTLFYYWAQTGGPACVLNNGGTALGTDLVLGAVAGSVKTQAGYTMPDVGWQIGVLSVDTEYYPVFLTID